MDFAQINRKEMVASYNFTIKIFDVNRKIGTVV